MGCLRFALGLFLLSGVLLAAIVSFLNKKDAPLVITERTYWGPELGVISEKEDKTIHPFKIVYDDRMISKLRAQLSETKWVEPLEDAKYHYGVNLATFRAVIDYWRKSFDFKKAEKDLNVFQHFKTSIEGLKIHFYRSTPKESSGTQVIPILLVHGWPGSFVEFLEITALLNKPVDGIAFDVIVPSIPGYGFSEASSKQGMDCAVTARIFNKLMVRLGHSKFFMQGGDWGSAVTAAMARLYPERLYGAHFNMLAGAHTPKFVAKQILYTWFPSYFGDGRPAKCLPVPYGQFFSATLRETGYMHIQSTKPDTIGFALLNSPAGLAAYIGEKFSTWTESGFRNLDDGGLTKKFTLDKILANIMVYYATDSIVSSQRYYRENVLSENTLRLHNDKITVPSAYALFPNELACLPRFLVDEIFTNMTTMTYMEDGGHFAAFEKPSLLEKDIRSFVRKVINA